MVASTCLLTHGFCTSPLCKKTLLHKVCPHAKQHVDKPPISNHEEAARNHEDTWLSNHVEGATLWRGRPRWDAYPSSRSSNSIIIGVALATDSFYI